MKKCLKRIGVFFILLVIMMSSVIIYLFWIHPSSAVIVYDTPLPTKRQLPVKNQKTIRILSIPGGALHGIISTYPLIYLEEKTGKPISELFDLFIGVSTGSIQTIFLNVPDAQGKPKYTARQLLDFYNNEARDIFYASWYHRILTLDGIIGPKYSSRSRAKVAQQLLGNIRFEDLLNNVVVPAYNTVKGEPVLFCNWYRPWGIQKENFYVRDLLLGAISPPYFFSPMSIDTARGNDYVLADAIIYMTNPSLMGLILSMANYPNHQYLLASFRNIDETMSIGAGSKSWGIIQWALEIVPLMIDANDQRSIMALKNYFGSLNYRTGKQMHHYFSLANVSNPPGIDDTSPENIARLNYLGAELVKQHQAELDMLAWQLTHDGDVPETINH